MFWLPRTGRRINAVAIAGGILVAVAFALRPATASSEPVALTVTPWDSSVLASIQIYPGLWPSASAQDGHIAGAEPAAEQIVPAGSAYRGVFRLKPGHYTVSAVPSMKGQQEHAHAIPAYLHLAKETRVILRDCTEAGTGAIAAAPAIPYSDAAMGAGRGRNTFSPPCTS